MVRLRRLAPDVYDPTGLAPVGERTLRCIDPSHDEPCGRCTAPPPNGEDGFWSLKGDPGKRNGDKKLRTLIQMTREWNSPVERAHLVHHLQNNPETRHMNKVIEIVRRKETPRLSKMCMMVLARAWGFKSDIWCMKCTTQPFYHHHHHQPQHHPQHHPPGGGGQQQQQQYNLARNVSSDLGSDANTATTQHHHHQQMLVSQQQQHQQAEQASHYKAAEERNQIEREVIAKFTAELDQANSFLSSVVEGANAESVGISGSPKDLSALEANTVESQKKFFLTSVRHVAENMGQMKQTCEEALKMVQHAQALPLDTLNDKPWIFISQLNQVDRFQQDFEQCFWTGLVSCQPDQYAVPTGLPLRDLARGMERYHNAALRILSIGKCEIAQARNLTFGEYCTIAMACLKVFYVLIDESAKSMARLKVDGPGMVPGASPRPSSFAPPQAQVSPPSYMSTQLTAPVLSAPVVDDTTATQLPDCLKLLRSLSNEIVFPRSISSEILLPFYGQL